MRLKRLGSSLILIGFAGSVMLSFQNCSPVKFAAPVADSPAHVDGSSVGATSIVINGGAPFTNTPGVQLTLSAEDAEEMYITNTPSCADGGVWEKMETARDWMIDRLNSTAFVYAKFRRGEKANMQETLCISASIIHDDIAPSVMFESGPNDFTNVDEANFVTRAEDASSGVAYYECRRDGEAFQKCNSVFRFTVSDEGPHKAYVRASDHAGNRSAEVEYPWLLDKTAPTVAIVDPKPPALGRSPSASVHFVANDGGSGIFRTLCRWDGGAEAECTSPDTLTGLTNGRHRFEVRAIDRAGNDSGIAFYEFDVDLIPSGPFNIIGVTGGTDTVKDAFLGTVPNPTVHWESSSGAVAYDLDVVLNSNGSQACPKVNVAAIQIPSYGYTTAQCSLTHSVSYRARVTAFDAVDNQKQATDFLFTVDLKGPAIIVNDPVVAENQATTINFTINDDVSGVKDAVCYRSFGTTVEQLNCKDLTSVVFTGLAPGEHTFYIEAHDNAGNSSESREVTFTVRAVRLVEKNITITAPPSKVDVLMVVDNSGSMAEEQRELGNRLQYFIDRLNGLDWQICLATTAVTTEDGRLRALVGPSPAQYVITAATPNYQKVFLDTVVSFGTNGSGDEQGIRTTVRAVERKENGCFRNDAALSVVVISDENERSNGSNLDIKNMPATAVSTVRQVLGEQKIFTFHSLVKIPGDATCTTASHTGDLYVELSGLSNGIVGSVCAPNYGQELVKFADSIRTNLDTVTLECSPLGNVEVNVNPRPAGLTHTVQGNKVKFSPALDPGTAVSLRYYCEVN